MYIIQASIEISASPEDVRKKFLDFSQIPTYHPNGFFKSISPEVPNKPLEPGSKMRNELEIMTVQATLTKNSPSCFQWAGGLPVIFIGKHSFRFEPSTKTQGGTTFIQEEKFTGVLSFIMGESFVAKALGLTEKTKRGWAKYNQDLKVWCEVSKAGNS